MGVNDLIMFNPCFPNHLSIYQKLLKKKVTINVQCFFQKKVSTLRPFRRLLGGSATIILSAAPPWMAQLLDFGTGAAHLPFFPLPNMARKLLCDVDVSDFYMFFFFLIRLKLLVL